jgi:hypothetical protein
VSWRRCQTFPVERIPPVSSLLFCKDKKEKRNKTTRLYWLRATGGFPFNTSLCQQSDSLVYHGAIRRHWEPKSFFRLFVFFRLDPLVRVCTVHTHNEREKKPKQQQTQTHKSPAGQSVVSFDQNLEATTTATTRHALDAQTTENVLSGFFF